MWQLDSPKRFYADPAVSILIGLIIFGGSLPLSELSYPDSHCYNTGLTPIALSSARVLLEAAPKGLDLQKVEEGLVKVSDPTSGLCRFRAI